MKRFVGMVLGAALVAAAPAQANFCGLFKGHKKHDAGCETACSAPAEPCAEAKPAPAPEVKWEEKEVTTYKCETKTRKVEVSVCKQVWKDVPYEYSVMEPIQVKETHKVTTYKSVPKTVPYTWTEYQAQTTVEKRTCTTYTCVPKTVTTTVPVCRKVACEAPAPAPCPTDCAPAATSHGCGLFGKLKGCFGHSSTHTSCAPTYTYVTEYQTVCKTVMERVPTTTTVDVPVTRCVPVVKSGTKTVYECVPETKDVDVMVTKCVSVKKTGTKKVCENVVTKEMVDQTYTEMVPHKEKVKVAVTTACATPCGMTGDCAAASDCAPKKKGCFSKLFSGFGHGHSRSCNSGCN